MKKVEAMDSADKTIDMPEYVHGDFAVIVGGNSMVNDRICDGDVVFCRLQETVESGEIAVVIVNNKVMLRRAYFNDSSIILQPANPEYEPIAFSGDKIKSINIIGKAVAFTGKLP